MPLDDLLQPAGIQASLVATREISTPHLSSPPESPYYAFSTLTAQTLSSGILATGSRAGLVSKLTGLSAKWKVIATTPTGVISVPLALALTCPRREGTFTISPSLMPT